MPIVVWLAAAVVVIVVAASLATDYLWFGSLGYARVFLVSYCARWALLLGGGAVLAGLTGLNAVIAFRLRPADRPDPRRAGGGGYRAALEAHRKLLLWLALLTIGGVSGVAMASQWQTWLLFWDRVPFGRTDPVFGVDISFFVFDYPFIRLLIGYLFAVVVVSLVVAAGVHALCGGLRWQGRRPAATTAAQSHVFLLLGMFVLLKGVAYWFDRYGIDFSQRGNAGTGASYTDLTAVLPAKTALAVIALLCALLFFAGAVRKRAMLPAVGFCLLVLSAILVGGLYPVIIQQFVVKPNELAKESSYITREISATRRAYGVSRVRVIAYPATRPRPPGALASQLAALHGVPLVDPALIAPAFQQLQQVKGYYKFPGALAVDRYLLPGDGPVPQDVVVGVRGLPGPPPGQQTWVNTHLVYTHGFGFVAARADSAQSSGAPAFVAGGIPPGGPLNRAVGRYQPRIYFGPQQDSYVIVGGRAGRNPAELDYPAGNGQRNNTYTGGGGVSLASPLTRLAYAVAFRQPDIALSGAVNARSRILYNRQPLQRVAAVAPFLTPDPGLYPVISGHQILWVVDCYTTTDFYPYSERVDLAQATATSQDPAGTAAGQVNYLRDSVKAVVNAYTGAVTLYQWGAADPILRAWEKAFPGLIKPARDIPRSLLAHLRYPQELFEVQRQILATYHVVGAQSFYTGQDFWSVAADPAGPAGSTLRQPPSYLTLSVPGYRHPEFSLVTAFVSRGQASLAAFMAVDSNPTQPGYGTIRILAVPQGDVLPGPAQVRGAFEAFPQAVSDFAAFRRGGSALTLGSLAILPVGGSFLYAEPVYVRPPAGQGGGYPVLRRVFVYDPSLAQPVGYGPSLAAALAQLVSRTAPATGTAAGPGSAVRADLQAAESDYARALADFGAGDFAGFGQYLALMKQELDDALRAAGVVGGRLSP